MGTAITNKYPLWEVSEEEPISETAKRVDELALLAEDWDGFDAPTISPVAIAAAKDFLVKAIDEAHRRRMAWRPPYDVAPTPDGGAYLHWHSPELQFIAQFAPETGEAILLVRDEPGRAKRFLPSLSELPAAIVDLLPKLADSVPEKPSVK